MTTKRMTCRAYIKSVNVEERTVEQIVSVFGNVDFGKDRVNLGAFVGSLGRWSSSGDPIPAIWSHSWDDPFAHIGAVLEAKELAPGDPLLPPEIADLGGLYTKYQVDELPFAEQVFHLLKNRRVREASFAYDVLREKKNPDGTTDLLELDLIEIGPTLKGMNPLTQLLSAKSQFATAMKAELVAAGMSDEAAATTADSIAEKAFPAHTFLPKDDDATRCSVCDLTRNTLGHLNLLAGQPEAAKGKRGTKAEVLLDGSAEDIQDDVLEAIIEWAQDNNVGDGGFYAAHLEATFVNETPVRAVFLIEGWNDPWGEGEYYEATFAVDPNAEDDDADADALVIQGDPRLVAIEGVIVPKARPFAKAAVLRDLLTGIGKADASSVKAIAAATFDANGDDHHRSKGRGVEARKGKAQVPEAEGSGSGNGEATRALLELDAIELS